jgi:hypothetical protein
LAVTSLRELALLYTGWLVISALAVWFLAKWSARKPLHGGVLVIAVAIMLICMGLVAYAFLGAAGPSRSWAGRALAKREDVIILIFILWPLATCVGAAQASLHLAGRRTTARWFAFACAVIIACLLPFALLAAGCGLAGTCL